MKQIKKPSLMEKVFADPKFKGKHVIVVGGKIFVAATGKQAGRILDKVHKKYPDETPAITYIPKSELLILWLK